LNQELAVLGDESYPRFYPPFASLLDLFSVFQRVAKL